MLSIVLVVFTVYIFWVLYRNEPDCSQQQVWASEISIEPTSSRKLWRQHFRISLQPVASKVTFYAIAFFTNYIAAVNALSWSVVREGELSMVISRYGSYFEATQQDMLIAAGFIALAVFIINWQLALQCANLFSHYLLKFCRVNKTRFLAAAFIFCSYFAYLVTLGIFWMFQYGYQFSHGLILTPVFVVLLLMSFICIPAAKGEKIGSSE